MSYKTKKFNRAQMAALTLLILLPFALSLFLFSTMVAVTSMRVRSNALVDLVEMTKKGKHVLDVEVCVEILNDSGTVKYEPRIVIMNGFNSAIEIDYIVVLMKGGGDIQMDWSLMLNPGEVRIMRPSNLSLSLSIYDGDYFYFKKSVDYIKVHTKYGGTFGASWGGVCWKS